jgi:hypothetical protein
MEHKVTNKNLLSTSFIYLSSSKEQLHEEKKKKKYQKYQQRLLLLSSLSYHQSWSRPLTPPSAADKLTRVLVKK